MFRKHYPNCCITIDCSKLFIEITSSLDKASACWSNYKHHYTVKCLIYITPNGTVSVFSNCHGGRATNVFIVQIVDFYKIAAQRSSHGRQGIQNSRHVSFLLRTFFSHLLRGLSARSTLFEIQNPFFLLQFSKPHTIQENVLFWMPQIWNIQNR